VRASIDVLCTRRPLGEHSESVDETSVVWWINKPTNGEVVQSGFDGYIDVICAHAVDYKDYFDSAELWTITATSR